MDFSNVMQEWKRMCESMESKYDDPCKLCPLYKNPEFGGCGAIFEMPRETNWDKIRETIIRWAKENPKPVYPSWIDWLQSMGLISKPYGWDKVLPGTADRLVCVTTEKAKENIPEEIAKKLGLEPNAIMGWVSKEDVMINPDDRIFSTKNMEQNI